MKSILIIAILTMTPNICGADADTVLDKYPTWPQVQDRVLPQLKVLPDNMVIQPVIINRYMRVIPIPEIIVSYQVTHRRAPVINTVGGVVSVNLQVVRNVGIRVHNVRARVHNRVVYNRATRCRGCVNK